MPQYGRHDSLDEAFKFLDRTAVKRRLWTVLHFGEGPFYSFWSTQTRGQQMFDVAKQQLMSESEDGKYDRIEAAKLADQLLVTNKDVPWGGHAEEAMILCFKEVLNDAKRDVKELKKAIVINSDSPCTILDRTPSDNIEGWPKSCTQKLVKLSKEHVNLEWVVFYMRQFGYFVQSKKDTDHKKFQKAFNRRPNHKSHHKVSIYPFTRELNDISKKYPRL